MANARMSCLKKTPSALILLAFLICPWLPGQEQPKDWLILYGDGFRFGVKEPAGWQGDWERASYLKSNIIFYPKGHDMTTAYGVIRFSVAMNTRDKIATESELAAFRTVASSLTAIDAVGSSGQPSSDFNAALKAADDNVKSKEGERYDETFARKAGPWLASAMRKCTKSLPNTELGPFTVLIRVDSSGKAEEVLVRPLTKVAQCLKPLFASAKHPKPPGPSWWVKMDIAIQ